MLEDNTRNNIKFVGVGRARDKVLVAGVAPIKNDTIEQYLAAVREVLSAPDFGKKVTPGARYRLGGELNAFNFTVDAELRVYIVISSQDYPERLVFQMINSLVIKFREFGEISLTCPANGLDKPARKLLTSLASEYDDPTKIDKLEDVKRKVDVVKGTMQENVSGMLRNIDLATNLDESSKQLNDQAANFRTQAVTFKRRELCRKYWLTCAMVGLVLVIIIVIILALFGPTLANAATTGGGSPAPAPTVPGLAPTFPPGAP